MASSLSSYVVDTFNDKTFSKLVKPGAQLTARLEQVSVTRGLEFDTDLKKSIYIWAGIGIGLLHVVAVIAYLNYEAPLPVVKSKHEVAIEFIKPEIPPPVIEPPPPPPPPPPKVQKVAHPPPQPIAALKTAPTVENVAPTDLTVQENTHAEATSGPVMAASGPVDKNAAIPEVVSPPAPPVPPAPKIEEPVTEATANANYLNNPKPEYPGVALRQGWGGTVILRVRVLASGSPESATVKKSSGRKVLDDAAINAAMKWTFVPSKRGSTPIDGWATVPITFNPEQ